MPQKGEGQSSIHLFTHTFWASRPSQVSKTYLNENFLTDIWNITRSQRYKVIHSRDWASWVNCKLKKCHWKKQQQEKRPSSYSMNADIRELTASKTPQICIIDNEKQYFCTRCTCIFHLLTFWRRSRSFYDVQWPVLHLWGRREHMMTNVQFCLLMS